MYNSILFHIIEAGDTYGIIFKKFLYSRIMQGFIVSAGGIAVSLFLSQLSEPSKKARPPKLVLSGCFSVLMGQPRANLARSPAPVSFPAASVSVTHSPNTETEEKMTIINLRDFYPYYTADSFLEMPDESAEAMAAFHRMEAAYCLRTYRHKAYYSLDRVPSFRVSPQDKKETGRHVILYEESCFIDRISLTFHTII